MRRLLTLSLVLLAPALAAAQGTDDDLARAHFESGSAYYEQGRYEDAAREFLESYRLSPRPVLLENVARAQERALKFDDAIATLERLLRDHPDYPQAATMRERIASYERLRDRLRGSGEDEPGDAEPGADEPSEAPPEEEARPPEPEATAEAAPPAPASEVGSAGGGGGGVSVPGLVLLGAGGALGLGAIVTGAASEAIYGDLQGACAGGCPAARQGDVDTGEALALTSTILLFPSVAAIGVGVVLLILDSGGGGEEEEAALRVVPGPGEGGVALEGRF